MAMYVGINQEKGLGRRPPQPPVRIRPGETADGLHTLAVEMVRLRNAYKNPNRSSRLACEYDPAEQVADRRYRMLRERLDIETRAAINHPVAGGLVFDVDRMDAQINGRWARLRGYEYALFRLLYRSAGYVVGLPEIMRVVWGREYDQGDRPIGAPPNRCYDQRIARSVIGRVRRKLAAIGGAGLIETRDMVGYMLRTESSVDRDQPRVPTGEVPRTCPTCATVFTIGRSGQQRYCSLPCFSRVQGRRHVEVHTGWKRQPAEVSA